MISFCRAPTKPARAARRRKVDAVEDRVFIAGAGPVGLVAAANLVRRGVPVTVFEAGAALAEESRASTFHPPTLDMLDELGAAAPLIAQGLIAPQLAISDPRWRDRHLRFRRHCRSRRGHPFRRPEPSSSS